MNAAIHPDYLALLCGVLAEPEDDGGRLVLADFLEEAGEEERSSFIRLQILLAGHPHGDEARRAHLGGECYCEQVEPGFHCLPCLDMARRGVELRRRERELFDAHGQTFILPLARALGVSEEPGKHKGNRYRFIGSRSLTLPSGGTVGVEWRRGFVHALTLTAADFLAHAGAIFSAQPVVSVTLAGKAPSRIGSGVFGWYRHVLPDGPAEDELPSELFDRLPPVSAGGNSWGTTGDVEAAQRHLSRACVSLGRALAGLPPLTRA